MGINTECLPKISIMKLAIIGRCRTPTAAAFFAHRLNGCWGKPVQSIEPHCIVRYPIVALDLRAVF
jgi:hypothetical protein